MSDTFRLWQPPKGPADTVFGADLEVGTQVGSYVIEEKRSRGGFATVYRARHAALGRLAAVKVLHRYLVPSPSALQQFREEALTVNKIRHPHIVDVFEIGGLADGRPYILMEWLEGRTLAEVLELRKRISPRAALAVMEELGAALSAAHQRGVVHRDVKASNVIVVTEANYFLVKLVDFGIAKLLDVEIDAPQGDWYVQGSFDCMAPEQRRGDPGVDGRADIFALGVLLYQLVTGELPVLDTTARSEASPAPPLLTPSAHANVPASIDVVVRRATEERAEDRYRSVEEFVSDLRRAASATAAIQLGPTRVVVGEGVAVLLETHLDLPAGEVEAEILADLEDVVGLAMHRLSAIEMVPVIETPALLLCCVLVDAQGADRRVRLLDAVRQALDLRALIVTRPGADPRVKVRLVVHAGQVVARIDHGTQMIGGRLLSPSDWPPARLDDAVTITARALHGVEDRLLVEPAGGLFRVVAVK